MNKAGFITRIQKWAKTRYGVDLTAAQINGLINDGLIPEAVRKGHDGQKPIYDYDFRAYRRALQIARLRKLGINGRDAIRLQLFLRGYGLQVWDVREAVLREYRHFAKSEAMRIRSSYIGNWKDVPSGRKASLMREMGEHDLRLIAVGWKLPDDVYIECVRAAKQKSLEDSRESLSSFGSCDKEATLEQMQAMITQIMQDPSDSFAGLLNFADSEADSKYPGSIEGLIQTADDATYLQARALYRLMTDRSGRLIFEMLTQNATAEDQAKAIDKIVASVKDLPELVCFIFVVTLRLVDRWPLKDINAADLCTSAAQDTFEKIAELPMFRDFGGSASIVAEV